MRKLENEKMRKLENQRMRKLGNQEMRKLDVRPQALGMRCKSDRQGGFLLIGQGVHIQKPTPVPHILCSHRLSEEKGTSRKSDFLSKKSYTSYFYRFYSQDIGCCFELLKYRISLKTSSLLVTIPRFPCSFESAMTLRSSGCEPHGQ